MREWCVYTRCRITSTLSGVRDERRQHPSDELGSLDLLVGLVGVNHELEAPDSVRNRDGRVRPLRVRTDLAIGMTERVGGQIDDEPARRRGGALERHVHQPSRGAATAVAAHDVTGRNRVGLTRHGDAHSVGGLLARLHCATPGDLDALEAVEAAQQLGVDHRLDEPVALRPAESRVGRRHLGQQPPVAVVETQNLIGDGVR